MLAGGKCNPSKREEGGVCWGFFFSFRQQNKVPLPKRGGYRCFSWLARLVGERVTLCGVVWGAVEKGPGMEKQQQTSGYWGYYRGL